MELQHRKVLLDRRVGCSIGIREKVLVMERVWTIVSGHQLILTFSVSCNAVESAVFHPKSHKRLI